MLWTDNKLASYQTSIPLFYLCKEIKGTTYEQSE